MEFMLLTQIDFPLDGQDPKDVMPACCTFIKELAGKPLPEGLPQVSFVERCWIKKSSDGATIGVSVLGAYSSAAIARAMRDEIDDFIASRKEKFGNGDPTFTVSTKDREIAIYTGAEAQQGIDPAKGAPHI